MTISEVESSAQTLVSQISSDHFRSLDSALRLAILRQLKHSIIGHEQQKSLLVNLGVVDPILSLLEQKEINLNVDARTEAITILGSLAHG